MDKYWVEKWKKYLSEKWSKVSWKVSCCTLSGARLRPHQCELLHCAANLDNARNILKEKQPELNRHWNIWTMLAAAIYRKYWIYWKKYLKSIENIFEIYQKFWKYSPPLQYIEREIARTFQHSRLFYQLQQLQHIWTSDFDLDTICQDGVTVE